MEVDNCGEETSQSTKFGKCITTSCKFKSMWEALFYCSDRDSLLSSIDYTRNTERGSKMPKQGNHTKMKTVKQCGTSFLSFLHVDKK